MYYQENLTHPLQSSYLELLRSVEITDVHGGKKSTFAYTRPRRCCRMTGGTETHDQKKIRVYADMCGDLFHFGHSEFLSRAIEMVSKKFNTTPYFIESVVGLYTNEEIANYKRDPILTLEERVRSALCSYYVDEVIIGVPIVSTHEFMELHNIDIVVHGDDLNETATEYYYGAVRDKFMLIDYGNYFSTTELIRRVKETNTEKRDLAKQDLK
jgi:glycerol-3-phosphate cytidylyltransferase-like family protein